jgi:hypothetical protein
MPAIDRRQRDTERREAAFSASGPFDHSQDKDCSVDPVTDVCSECGVYHGEPCEDCGGRGFHLDECLVSDNPIRLRKGWRVFRYADGESDGGYVRWLVLDTKALAHAAGWVVYHLPLKPRPKADVERKALERAYLAGFSPGASDGGPGRMFVCEPRVVVGRNRVLVRQRGGRDV